MNEPTTAHLLAQLRATVEAEAKKREQAGLGISTEEEPCG